MAERPAGQVGGQTVEDQVAAGGAGGNVAVVGIKRYASHLLLMVLREKEVIFIPLCASEVKEAGGGVKSYLEGAVQSLGLQVPDVHAVIETSADQKLRRGAQTHPGLLFLNTQVQTSTVTLYRDRRALSEILTRLTRLSKTTQHK